MTAAPGQIITLVVRGGSSTNTPPAIAPNPLSEDELSFVDRTHQYNAVPADLLGAQYVMVPNNDKVQADYSLDVELIESARLYLFLDNRLGHGSIPGGDPVLNPDLWSAGMAWVYDIGFADTGLNIGIDEGGDGQINQWASVYVKKVEPGLITLYQQNDPTDPTYRNMYGVAALKWRSFEAFWFDNGRLNLAQTPDWVTVLSGFYGGWDWFDEDGHWRQPFEDKPLGGPNLWAFTDRLTFQYTDAKVRPVHRWFFLWDPSGQGNCLELMFEDVGGLVGPLNPDIMDNLVIHNHSFSVNADKVQGVFSDLEFIRIDELEEHVRGLGMTEEDVQIFMSGDIFSHLKITDPCDQGDVGVQYTQWQMSEPMIMVPKHIEITEGDVMSYPVRLGKQPDGPVTVNVKYNDPTAIKWADYDDDVYQLHFDQLNWDKEQVVNFAATTFMDNWMAPPDQTVAGSIAGKYFFGEWIGSSTAGKYFLDNWIGGKPGQLAHYVAGDPTETAVLPVRVMDKKTGGRGYAETDFNRDAITNLVDVAYVANAFLESTEQPQVFAPLINPDEFTGVDIGIEGGSASFDPQTGTWIVTADGADIWGTSDQFHFVYQDVCDMDFQVTATVTDLEDTHEWAKAGIMLRDELTQDSAYSMIAVTPGRGLAFQVRYNSGETTVSMHGGPAAHLKVPISLRLVAIGHTVTGYYYADGMWIKLGATTDDCKCYGADNAGHVGLAVTSHVEGTPTTATFGSELVSLGP
ncbi:MAG: hypothetical protein ACYS6K_18345 [Planctomycetota bacterium]